MVARGRWWRCLRHGRGVAALELALVLPLFIMLLASIVDVWRFTRVHDEAQHLADILGEVLSRNETLSFCDLPVLLRYAEFAPGVFEDEDAPGQARQPGNYRIFISLVRGEEDSGGMRSFVIAGQASYGLLNAESSLGEEGDTLSDAALSAGLQELLDDFLVTLVATEVWISVEPFIMPEFVGVAASGPFYRVFRGGTRTAFEEGITALRVETTCAGS